MPCHPTVEFPFLIVPLRFALRSNPCLHCTSLAKVANKDIAGQCAEQIRAKQQFIALQQFEIALISSFLRIVFPKTVQRR